MAPGDHRILPATRGMVGCVPDKDEPVTHCRFCAHSRAFLVRGEWVTSPALAYCPTHQASGVLDITAVSSVRCADTRMEGFRSIMSIIS
ncbi:MAG: hypothetical protein NT074_05920 [Methanomicrobiales archaeon]|nr:hypothetical protein [Methanomicrobiales archaeon]